MASEDLSIKFDGAAVDGHMDVRELAPSLLGFSDALRASQRALYPDDEPAAVRITASNDGSFEVTLELAVGVLASAQQMLTGTPSEVAQHLREVVATFREYLTTKVALSGREPRQVTDRGDGTVEVDVSGTGNTLIVNNHTNILLQDPAVNHGTRDALKPLNAEGIDSLKLDHRGEQAYVHRADRAAFNLPSEESASETKTWEMSLQVLAGSFVDGRQWRFRNDDTEFGARITDQVWLDNHVATRREAFRAGDVLRARVAVTTAVEAGKPTTTYEVVEVLRHDATGGENVPLIPPSD